MLLAAAVALAIVTQDAVPLRAAPRRSAQQHATLWQGDTLEVRGERLDYLQVYDHRRERAGYVHASAAHIVTLEAADAPELLAVVRFVRDTPGSESLGIAYAAAYLKAAPAEEIGAEAFAALGSMADRLASRASRGQGSTQGGDAKLAAHLDIAASYGLAFKSFEREGRIQLCYEGAALRRVLALPASAQQLAQAALGLTRHECVDPNLPPLEMNAFNAWRAEVLDRVDLRELPLLLKNRVRMRRAGVWAARAFAATRTGDLSAEAGSRALQELSGVVNAELTETDRDAYTEAAVRVGASRWASEPDDLPAVPGAGLGIATQAGAPGETCVLLLEDTHDARAPLTRRCTYGTVWAASATPNKGATALALAVQPLAAWRELWVFRKAKDGWTVSVLPPAADGPDLGYAEFAGWVPNKPQLLVAREARVDGHWQRSFELVRLDTLTVVKRADDPSHLSAFYRWQSPAWMQLTVSLR